MRAEIGAEVATEIAAVVLSLAVEKGAAVASRGESAVAVGVVKVIGVVGSVVTVAAVHGGVVVVVAWSIMVIHVDPLVSLLVVRCHGKCSLIRVDVVATADLAAVVAGESAVEVVVLQGVGTEEGRSNPEETTIIRSMS